MLIHDLTLCTMSGGAAGVQVYWRQAGGPVWHCFRKAEGQYVSLCGGHKRRRQGGDRHVRRPVLLLRCPRCNDGEMRLRDWAVPGPVSSPPVDEQVEQRFFRALNRWRLAWASEQELQAGIAQMLDAEGLEYEREASLCQTDRPDFTLGPIAVEVKTSGSASAVLRQLQRYAAHERVDRLVLLTTKLSHALLPATVLGKPLRVVYLPNL